MDELVKSLVPAFACGLGVQRALELADLFIGRMIGGERKKTVLGWLSFLLGIAFSGLGGIRVLNIFSPNYPFPFLDVMITALIISSGTEGFNSIMKFLFYKKEEQKAETDNKQQTTPAVSGVNRQPSPPELILPEPAVV